MVKLVFVIREAVRAEKSLIILTSQVFETARVWQEWMTEDNRAISVSLNCRLQTFFSFKV